MHSDGKSYSFSPTTLIATEENDTTAVWKNCNIAKMFLPLLSFYILPKTSPRINISSQLDKWKQALRRLLGFFFFNHHNKKRKILGLATFFFLLQNSPRLKVDKISPLKYLRHSGPIVLGFFPQSVKQKPKWHVLKWYVKVWDGIYK